MLDYGDKECSAFYRVHVKLDDPESESHLVFDFPDRNIASAFADQAYMSCDINKVWTEIITNEFNTTESPLWRSCCNSKRILNSKYGYAATDSVKEVLNGT